MMFSNFHKNIKVVSLFLIGLFIACWLYSCASTGSPTGGPKDTTPPKMDSLTSTRNKQINFKPRELVFHFDEFVEVKDAIKQVLVSPPLTYIPQVKHRGKKVTFKFDDKEILKDNATYTINFGESIVDFHEGNKLQNFSFVFATGNVLDSMSIKGKIIDALTNEPEKDMIVFLYDNTMDSIVAKEKPFYSTKTDKSGNFIFANIKSDTFKLFALKDENINYLYDLENEKIAFLDSLIILKDTLSVSYTLTSSLPNKKTKILSKNTKEYGKVNILFSTEPNAIAYSISDSKITTYKDVVNDSLNIYYHTDIDSFYIYVLDDTIQVKPRKAEEFYKKNTFKKTFSTQSKQMLTKDSIIIGFNFPLKETNMDKIIIEDSIGILDDVQIVLAENKKQLTIKYNWLAGETYKLSIDSGYLENIYGMVNDSIGFGFSILKPEQTGSMHAVISDLDSTKAYVIKILREKTVILENTYKGKSDVDLNLKGLIPDRYNIEIIDDDNENGIWDAGNYWESTQPEKIKQIKGDKLRENWESEFNVSWKSAKIEGNEPKQPQSGLGSGLRQNPKN